MIPNYKFLFLALALVTMAASCKKEEHKCTNTAPVVSIESPTDGAGVQPPDSVHIAGMAYDDVWLNSLHISVENDSGTLLYNQMPFVYGMDTFQFAFDLHLVTAGNYHLKVTAEANDSVTTEKEVHFSILP